MDLAAVDFDARPAAVFVDAGASSRGAQVVGLGARWPSGWQAQALGGKLGLALEVGVHAWSVRQDTGDRQRSVQFTATPVIRWRGQDGASPWFIEVGIGLSYHDKAYGVKSAHQSTRWNFNDVIGVGRHIGQHELGLRLTHFSNAGLRKPNPGDSSVSLRWGYVY